jgi:chorismate--pyruvate lyase
MNIPCWQSYHSLRHLHHACISPLLLDWLLDQGSFVERLKAYGVASPRVEVTTQRWQVPMRDERDWLVLPDRVYALVREVFIYSDDIVWMFARSVFPTKSLTGKERQLAHLKNRSLGSVLFKNPSLERSPFELASFHAGMAWYDKINQRVELEASAVWGRRSLFHINNKPLLLSEVFLPSILNLNLNVD